MDYQLTQHAKDVLLKRQIPREWMENALFRPQWTEPDSVDPELEHRLAVIPEFQGRILRVVVNVIALPPRVVTVHFDRRRKQR
jgi:hypothetical protein